MEEYKAIGEKLFEDLFSSDKSVNLESIEEKYWSLSADDQKSKR